MKLTTLDSGRKLARTDLLVLFRFEGRSPSAPDGVSFTPAFLKSSKAEFRAMRSTDAAKGAPGPVLVIGLGKRGELDAERLRRAGALAVKTAEARGAASATIWTDEALAKAAGGAEEAGLALAEGAVMGAYRYHPFKSKPEKAKLAKVQLAGSGAAFARAAKRGVTLAEANAFTRDLQNAPGNQMRPRDMAAAARKLARASTRITAKVHDEKAMKAMGMGSLLSVSAGSREPAFLIHLTYKPKGRSKGRVAFVGKGLTFDAGGISLKPAAKMWDMKYDMSGGAAVLGAFHALAKLDFPYEVHGVVPTSENLPDGLATKPGDLVTAMNGTTIEVLNTDAEGRLILCDALCYTAQKIKPDTIVDLATLTGAVVVACGHEFTGLFTRSPKLRAALERAGEAVGERVWPLPLEDYHKEQLKGEVGDLRNINSPDHGGGSSAGAAFLWHFVETTEWAHLDIAGAAWGGRARDWVGGPQGSGVGTRLLVRYLEERGR